MKVNPLEWSEVDETTFEAEGLLLLRSAALFAVAIETAGVEVCVGEASLHRIPLSEASKVTLIGGDMRVYRKEPPSRVYRMTGEKFTNIDRLPQESGTVAEVTKALRIAKLEQRAMIREIREEHARNKAELAAARAKEESLIESESEQVSEPEGEVVEESKK